MNQQLSRRAQPEGTAFPREHHRSWNAFANHVAGVGMLLAIASVPILVTGYGGWLDTGVTQFDEGMESFNQS